MKYLRLLMSLVLISISTAAFAQSDSHQHPTDVPKVQTDA